MWSAGRSVSSMTKFVCESIARRRDGYGADILGQSASTKHGGGLTAGNGVADTRSGQAVNVREGARYDQPGGLDGWITVVVRTR
jgi:hypothetical protein